MVCSTWLWDSFLIKPPSYWDRLSSRLLTLNLLAFALDTFQKVSDAGYQSIRAAVGAHRKFFQHLEALTAYWFFQDWEQLMDFMMRGQETGPYVPRKN